MDRTLGDLKLQDEELAGDLVVSLQPEAVDWPESLESGSFCSQQEPDKILPGPSGELKNNALAAVPSGPFSFDPITFPSTSIMS